MQIISVDDSNKILSPNFWGKEKFEFVFWFCPFMLTLVPLNPDIPCFANSVDPDQLASEEANWSGSALFAIKFVNL